MMGRNLGGMKFVLTVVAIALVATSGAWAKLEWKIGHMDTDTDTANRLLRPASGGGNEVIPGNSTVGVGALVQIIFSGAADQRANPAHNPLLWGGDATGASGNDVVLAVWSMGAGLGAAGTAFGVNGTFLYPDVAGPGASMEGAPLQVGDQIFARVWNLPAASWTGNPTTTVPDFSQAGLTYVDSGLQTLQDTAPPNFPQSFFNPVKDIFASDKLADTAALPIPEPSAGLLGLVGAAILIWRRRRG